MKKVSKPKRPWNARTKVRIGAQLDQEIARVLLATQAIDERSKAIQSAGDSEVDAKLADLESQELIALREAKLRFASADFGRCVLCGHWIEKKRMLALPIARTCIKCARLAEASKR